MKKGISGHKFESDARFYNFSIKYQSIKLQDNGQFIIFQDFQTLYSKTQHFR